MDEFSRLLRSFVSRSGKSASSLSESAILGPDTLNSWMRSAAHAPRPENVIAIATQLGLSSSELDDLLDAREFRRKTLAAQRGSRPRTDPVPLWEWFVRNGGLANMAGIQASEPGSALLAGLAFWRSGLGRTALTATLVEVGLFTNDAVLDTTIDRGEFWAFLSEATDPASTAEVRERRRLQLVAGIASRPEVEREQVLDALALLVVTYLDLERRGADWLTVGIDRVDGEMLQLADTTYRNVVADLGIDRITGARGSASSDALSPATGPFPAAADSYLADLRERCDSTPPWFPTSSQRRLRLRRHVSADFSGQLNDRPAGTTTFDAALDGVDVAAIVAPAGYGKTWALRSRLATLMDRSDPHLPIWVHAQQLATSWASGGSIVEVIAAAGALASRSRSHRSAEELLIDLLATRAVAIAVDGLDEVHDPALRNELDSCLEALVAWARQGTWGSQVLLASRPEGFRPPARDFAQRGDGCEVIVQLVDLDRAQVEDFFDEWCVLRGGDVARQRLRHLTEHESPVRAATTVPLLASLAAWVAESREVPTTHAALYDEVIGRFLQRRWKANEAGSPLGDRTDDAAWLIGARTSLQHLAIGMAEERDGWKELIDKGGCERLLASAGALEPRPGRSLTWTMCFEVGALTAAGFSIDAVDVPIGWVHRSFQDFLVAEALIERDEPPERLAELAATPGWTNVVTLLSTLLAARGRDLSALLDALRRNVVERDPFGLSSESLATLVAATPDLPLDVELVEHLRVRCRSGVIAPGNAARALGARAIVDLLSLLDSGFPAAIVLRALTAIGDEGRAALRRLIVEDDRALGAARVLAEFDELGAAMALMERHQAGIDLSASDLVVLSAFDPSLKDAAMRAYLDDPASPEAVAVTVAMAPEGAVPAMVEALSHVDPVVRFHALGALDELLRFSVPDDVVTAVGELAERDDDHGVRSTASMLMRQWGQHLPNARRASWVDPSVTEARRADPVSDGIAFVLSYFDGGPEELSAGLQSVRDHPEWFEHPELAERLASVHRDVDEGRYQWLWLWTYLDVFPERAGALLSDVHHGRVEPGNLRDALLGLAMCHVVPVRERVRFLFDAVEEHHDEWAAGFLQTFPHREPQAVLEVVCEHLEGATRAINPNRLRVLLTMGRSAIQTLQSTAQLASDDEVRSSEALAEYLARTQ